MTRLIVDLPKACVTPAFVKQMEEYGLYPAKDKGVPAGKARFAGEVEVSPAESGDYLSGTAAEKARHLLHEMRKAVVTGRIETTTVDSQEL